MKSIARYVGLDVHKATISLAVCRGGVADEVRCLGRIPHDLSRLLRRLERLGPAEALHVAYEAGPTGYGLCRALRERGIRCQVIAPSRTPIRSGDRVKTDRRDAEKLARFLRAGELVAIDVPSVDQEALRDLVRIREDAVYCLHGVRRQLSAFLLRHGRSYEGKSTWTKMHMLWIQAQRFESEAQQQVLEDYCREVLRGVERIRQLTEKVELTCESGPDADTFRWMRAVRGISTIIAATLVAEIGDFRRFPSAGRFMGYVGLTPSEYSSGATTKRGRITRAGNPHVRRALNQAAWSARLRPAMSQELKSRSRGVPLPILDIAWKAQQRLHKLYWRLIRRNKPPQVAVTAVARELAGFVWAIGQHAH